MTLKQRLLRRIYPFFMTIRGLGGKKNNIKPSAAIQPPVDFYSLHATLNNGQDLAFEKLRGKKVLLVNTASNCGFTGQYDELQKLYQHSREDLEIIGFPANDFSEQEKGSDQEIEQFCRVNYGVSFPLAKKSSVVAGSEQNAVYRWLTDRNSNGWNDQPPTWNFAKYLIDEDGRLTHYFDPSTSPLSEPFMEAIGNRQ